MLVKLKVCFPYEIANPQVAMPWEATLPWQLNPYGTIVELCKSNTRYEDLVLNPHNQGTMYLLSYAINVWT